MDIDIDIDRYGTYLTDLTKKLIAFDTANPPGNEAPLAEYLKDVLGGLGFRTSVEYIDTERANITARTGCGDGGKRLVLNGHLDVVPPGTGWTNPPFEAKEKDGKIFGRGAADMKGAVASMITAAKKFNDIKSAIHGELVLAFVADEELYSRGTLRLLKTDAGFDYAVIGEPTNLELHIAHRGVARFRISTYGKSVHAGGPERGINAIDKMGVVLGAMGEYAQRLSLTEHDLLPSPCINVDLIRGGTAANIIPDSCEIIVDRRLVPGETPDGVFRELEHILEGLRKGNPDFRYDLFPLESMSPGELSPDSDFLYICRETYRDVFGKPPRVGGFNASCEQTFFLKEGVEAIVFGPGRLQQAHIVDEYVEVDQLKASMDYYTALMLKVLV